MANSGNMEVVEITKIIGNVSLGLKFVTNFVYLGKVA